MKMLFVSDYAPWYKVSEGKMPSQHLFGIHEWIDQYAFLEENWNKQVYRGKLKKIYSGGYVDFCLVKTYRNPLVQIFYSAFSSLAVALRSRKYDYIYLSVPHCVPFVGFFRKIRVIRSKVIAVMHHPPFRQLRIGKYDAVIFFNMKLLQLASSLYPSIKDSFYCNEWGPDLNWYKRFVGKKEKCVESGMFIDNGKSRRDSELFKIASDELDVKVFTYSQIPENGTQIRENPDSSTERTNSYRCIVIPVKEVGKKDIVCGLTSFMDAIALCKPVIVSDNVCFAKDVQEHSLGLVYKTGDKNSLISAMRTMKEDLELYKSCVEALKEYRKTVNIDKYSKKLYEIVSDISNPKVGL